MTDNNNQRKAILLLDDGTCFEGIAVGHSGTAVGEICFNTGMTGYQEVFTDPSYYGQILVTTNVHIGNYGVKDVDTESEKVQIRGLICREYTDDYSRPLADNSIDSYFKDEKIVAITNVDTRSIVKHIRDKGAMNCIISSDDLNVDSLKKELSKAPDMSGLELASKVTTSEPYMIGSSDAPFKIAVLDFGTKKNILTCLADQGAYLRVYPAKSSMEELLSFSPDAFFLSNGPGDPASMDYAIETVKEILKTKKPCFGICLGHQLLALAMGVSTYKMHHGHRGINHPVKNIRTGKCEITSQNHGFAVDADQLRAKSDLLEITHINLNDDTIEGMRVKGQDIYSVQYHPEAAPGPHDSRYLFGEFIDIIKKSQSN